VARTSARLGFPCTISIQFGRGICSPVCVMKRGPRDARVASCRSSGYLHQTLRLIIPTQCLPRLGAFRQRAFSNRVPSVNSLIACPKAIWMESVSQRKEEPILPEQ
jgi:hypothetical protein